MIHEKDGKSTFPVLIPATKRLFFFTFQHLKYTYLYQVGIARQRTISQQSKVLLYLTFPQHLSSTIVHIGWKTMVKKGFLVFDNSKIIALLYYNFGLIFI